MKTKLVGMQRVFNFDDSFQHILQGRPFFIHLSVLKMRAGLFFSVSALFQSPLSKYRVYVCFTCYYG